MNELNFTSFLVVVIHYSFICPEFTSFWSYKKHSHCHSPFIRNKTLMAWYTMWLCWGAGVTKRSFIVIRKWNVQKKSCVNGMYKNRFFFFSLTVHKKDIRECVVLDNLAWTGFTLNLNCPKSGTHGYVFYEWNYCQWQKDVCYA